MVLDGLYVSTSLHNRKHYFLQEEWFQFSLEVVTPYTLTVTIPR